MVGIIEGIRHYHSSSSRQGKCGSRCFELEAPRMCSLDFLKADERPSTLEVQTLARQLI